VNNNTNKINNIVSEKRVKLHVFEPSKRKIWTIVGKGKEHWLDPELDFCSCPGYYFSKSNEKKECYHLKAVQLAKKDDKIELIKFSDKEFDDFISGLISDL